ncbi:hypothetical protein GCM10023162_34510 [Klenkia terrae]
MSDDAFQHFRLWLVLQGRSAFELVLADPDALAELPWGPDGESFDVAEAVGYLADEVLTELGQPGDDGQPAVLDGEPSGARFDDEDADWLAATFPRIRMRTSASGEPAEEQSSARASSQPCSPARLGRLLLGPALWAPRPAPMSTAPLTPLLAAALFERGQIRHEDRPMLAAHWIAEGREGDAVLELASLRGHEPEVSELWPAALAELGAAPPDGQRAAMAWGAELVLAGDRDLRWLTRLLWPSRGVTTDPDIDELVYTLDDTLDWTDRDLGSRRTGTRQRAESARAAVDAAVRAMAQGDVAAARHLLDSWHG